MTEPNLQGYIATTVSIATRPDLDEKVQLLLGHVAGLLVAAKARQVQTDDDVVSATNDLSIMAGFDKTIEEKRKEYTCPLNEHLKAINNAFRLLTEPLAEADKLTRGKILAYRQEIEDRRREAEKINLPIALDRILAGRKSK